MRWRLGPQEDFFHACPAKIIEQCFETSGGTTQVRVVAESRKPWRIDAWLLRIYLPGMQVEHRRQSLVVGTAHGPAKQTVRQQAEVPAAGDGDPPLKPADYWRAVRANRAFWVVMVGIITAVICSTALGKSVLYYFKYYLQDEAASRMALSIPALAGLVVIPAWLLATRIVGKRNAWFLATGWGLVGLAAFALTDIRDSGLMIGFLLYMSVCSLGLALTFWSMLPDTVEYGEWASGLRAESFVFGLGQFFLKVAMGLGAGLFGLALDLVGYVPNVAQTPQTLQGMKAIMVVMPAVGLALGALAMLFHPLKRGVHESIVEQLAERRAAAPEALTIQPAE